MANDGGNVVPRLTKAEHIGPNDTGDNIEAKRVAGYEWTGSDWQRVGLKGLLPFEFDDMQFTNPDANGNYQTITVKNNTTTVATLTLTFDINSKLTGLTRA